MPKITLHTPISRVLILIFLIKISCWVRLKIFYLCIQYTYPFFFLLHDFTLFLAFSFGFSSFSLPQKLRLISFSLSSVFFSYSRLGLNGNSIFLPSILCLAVDASLICLYLFSESKQQILFPIFPTNKNSSAYVLTVAVWFFLFEGVASSRNFFSWFCSYYPYFNVGRDIYDAERQSKFLLVTFTLFTLISYSAKIPYKFFMYSIWLSTPLPPTPPPKEKKCRIL